jgi:hypothetical protein
MRPGFQQLQELSLMSLIITFFFPISTFQGLVDAEERIEAFPKSQPTSFPSHVIPI